MVPEYERELEGILSKDDSLVTEVMRSVGQVDCGKEEHVRPRSNEISQHQKPSWIRKKVSTPEDLKAYLVEERKKKS